MNKAQIDPTAFEVSHFPVGSNVGVGGMMYELLQLWEDDSDFLPRSTRGKCKSSKKGFLSGVSKC